jgi:hypothetical protein
VRVMINKTRRYDATLGVDGALRCGSHVFANPGDLAALDGNIRLECRRARTVHDPAVLDEQIISHAFSSAEPAVFQAPRASRMCVPDVGIPTRSAGPFLCSVCRARNAPWIYPCRAVTVASAG